MLKATFAAGDQKEQAFKLLSGHALPAVGLGTWRLASQAYDSVFFATVEVSQLSTFPQKLVLLHHKCFMSKFRRNVTHKLQFSIKTIRIFKSIKYQHMYYVHRSIETSLQGSCIYAVSSPICVLSQCCACFVEHVSKFVLVMGAGWLQAHRHSLGVWSSERGILSSLSMHLLQLLKHHINMS